MYLTGHQGGGKKRSSQRPVNRVQTVEELQRLSGGSVIKIEWVLLYYQEALLGGGGSVVFITCRVQPCSMCPDATYQQYRTARTNGNLNGHYDFAYLSDQPLCRRLCNLGQGSVPRPSRRCHLDATKQYQLYLRPRRRQGV